MRSEWKSSPLSDKIILFGGGTPKTDNPNYWNGSIPWLSVKDFNNDNRYVYSSEKTITDLGLKQSATQLLAKDDIIISARGTVGELAMIPFPMAFNQSCYGVRPQNSQTTDATFLYYVLCLKINELKQKSHGSVFNTITRETFSNIEVNWPQLFEQRTIAATLSCLDDKIELNNKINANLEAQAQAIFKSWFIDFEPFRDGEFVDSELGPIPKGWKVISIGELPVVITDYVANGSFASLKENVSLCDYPEFAVFIRNTDLKSGVFKTYVDEHSYNFLSKSKLFGGEIIISNVGDVGSVFICPDLKRPMTLGNNVIMLNSKNLNLYFYYLFKSHVGQHLIDSITGGSVQSKFNKTDFRSLKICVPDDSVLGKYNAQVKTIHDSINSFHNQSRTLATLRDTLLPKLMSGEIEVPVQGEPDIERS